MFEGFIGVNFWTALFVLLNTLAVFFVAKKYLFVPVKNMIDERQKEIDTMYDDANTAKEEALKLQNEYEEKILVAQDESERIVKEAMIRGQNREEEIVQAAQKEASAILEKAEADIAQEKKKAMNDAKNEISEIAIAIAEKVIDRELNADDHQKLVDSFIDSLGDTV